MAMTVSGDFLVDQGNITVEQTGSVDPAITLRSTAPAGTSGIVAVNKSALGYGITTQGSPVCVLRSFYTPSHVPNRIVVVNATVSGLLSRASGLCGQAIHAQVVCSAYFDQNGAMSGIASPVFDLPTRVLWSHGMTTYGPALIAFMTTTQGFDLIAGFHSGIHPSYDVQWHAWKIDYTEIDN